MDSFLVSLWLRLLRLLRVLSPFQWLCWAMPRLGPSYAAVELWVLGHLVLSVIFLLGLQHPLLRVSHFWHTAMCAYAGIRVFEIVAINALVLLDIQSSRREPEKPAALGGYRRLLLLVAHNYAEVALWFAFVYAEFPGHFSTTACNVRETVCAIYFSVITMATVGYGDITPMDGVGRALVVAQISVGIFLTVVILARVIANLPQLPSLDPNEKRL